jgi:hypothetical protein
MKPMQVKMSVQVGQACLAIGIGPLLQPSFASHGRGHPKASLGPPGMRNVERIQPGTVILMYAGFQPEEPKRNPG